MTESAPEPPDIPDSAEVETPPKDDETPAANPNKSTRLTDPEAEHRRGIEKFKLKFAIWLVGLTTSGVFVIAIIGYFSPGYMAKSEHGLSATADVLKLLATTSLGFIFGRALSNGD